MNFAYKSMNLVPKRQVLRLPNAQERKKRKFSKLQGKKETIFDLTLKRGHGELVDRQRKHICYSSENFHQHNLIVKNLASFSYGLDA